MKSTTLILCLCIFMVFTAYGQTVNDVPIKDIDTEYLEIVGSSRFMSDKVNIEIDFGQDTKFLGSNKKKRIKDEDGKRIKFNSMVDALNFISRNGYSFVQAYGFAEDKQNVYHYLMKKKSHDKED